LQWNLVIFGYKPFWLPENPVSVLFKFTNQNKHPWIEMNLLNLNIPFGPPLSCILCSSYMKIFRSEALKLPTTSSSTNVSTQHHSYPPGSQAASLKTISNKERTNPWAINRNCIPLRPW
jgi:hypothetical protein